MLGRSSSVAPRPWLLLALPVLLIAIAWQPGFAAPYQYDDYVTPLADPASQSVGAWARALPTTLRPLTKLTYAIESSLGASQASARRVLNILLFLISAAFVGLLTRATGVGRAASALVATIWALHPVHSETVIALAGRSVLLSLCLMLASAWLLSEDRPGFACACALCALLARETALPWLVVCTSLAVWRGSRSRVALLATALAAGVIGCLLVLASTRMRELLAFSWEHPGAWNRLGLQWAALPRGTLLWLTQPAAFSGDMEFAPAPAARLVYVLLALCLYGFMVWLAFGRARPAWLRSMALLWLCLVLPLHSIVPKLDALTARDVSASSAALIVLLSAGAARLSSRGARWPLAGWLSACGLLMLLITSTRTRAALYRDPIALWRDAAERSVKSTRPLLNLGTLLAQRGQLEEAREALQTALRRNAYDSEARAKLAAVDSLIETRRLLTDPQRDGTAREP